MRPSKTFNAELILKFLLKILAKFCLYIIVYHHSGYLVTLVVWNLKFHSPRDQQLKKTGGISAGAFKAEINLDQNRAV